MFERRSKQSIEPMLLTARESEASEDQRAGAVGRFRSSTMGGERLSRARDIRGDGGALIMTDRPAWVDAMLARDLTPIEYRLWAYLSWREGANGRSWPSQATIAADLGLTPRAVRGIVRRLKDKAWLTVEWPGGPGRGHACIYFTRCPEKGHDDSSLTGEKTGTANPLSSDEYRNESSAFGDENRNGASAKSGMALPPNTTTEHLQKEKRPAAEPRSRIQFDRDEGAFLGIVGRLDAWRQAYPDLDVPREIRRAAAWVAANPSKAKKNWSRFIVNWLARADRETSNGQRRQHTADRGDPGTGRPSFRGQTSRVGITVDV